MDGRGSILLLLMMIICSAQVVSGHASSSAAEEELRETLFMDYDKITRPDNVTIMFSTFTIVGYEMHEEAQALEMNVWPHWTWVDPRLTWNKDEHDGVDQLAVDPETIWMPDLTVYNAHEAEDHKIKGDPHHQALLFPSTVLYIPAIKILSSCVMDMTYWPHDTHNCSVKIGSWVHHGSLIDLKLDEHFKIEYEMSYTQMADGRNLSRVAWDIVDTTAIKEAQTYDCCPDDIYVDILYTFLIRRNAPIYEMVVQVPAVCLCLLSVVVFLLPPSAGEKIVLGVLSLLLDLLFLIFTFNVVGSAPSHTPLIVQMVSEQMVLVLFSLIVSALVVRISRVPHNSGLPLLIRKPALFLARFFCVSNYGRAASGSHQSFPLKPEDTELGEDRAADLLQRDNMNNAEWILMAALIDRFFLFLYIIICIITLSCFSSVL